MANSSSQASGESGATLLQSPPQQPHNVLSKLPQGPSLAGGHRGFKGRFPENTLLAFDQAMTLPADVLELDVRLSADGVLVLSHDGTTKRVFGEPDHVIEKTAYKSTLDQLVAVVNRDSKSPDAVQGMPTFAQVVDRLVHDARYTNARVIVDIKPIVPLSVISQVVSTLQQANPDLAGFWASRVVLGIWTPRFLQAALVDAAPLKIMHIGVSRRMARWFLRATLGSDRLCSLSLTQITYTAGRGGKQLMADARDRGLALWAWTINTDAQMKWAVAAGFDGVITDFPDRFQELTRRVADDKEARAQLELDIRPTWWQRYVVQPLMLGLMETFVFVILFRIGEVRLPNAETVKKLA